MIYDCFMFFNELDLLEIRLNILDKFVDKFVIVESTFTHSNKIKKLYFKENKDRFEKFNNKIIYLIKDTYNIKETQQHLLSLGVKHNESIHSYTWLTEIEHRNYISNGLENCNNDDIILISDIDEIPDFDRINNYFNNNLNNIKDDIIYDCEGLMFYYYLNVIMNQKWVNTKIVRYSTMINNNLRPSDVARYSGNLQRNKIENCGWHFSYLGGPEQIKFKLESFMHQEMLNNRIIDINNIRNNLNNLQDPLHRSYYKYEKININILPEYIIDNKDKYKEFILN